ncbi:hypothetical protein Maksa_00007 [Pseudomonas phage vB_PpuP-Maksa]
MTRTLRKPGLNDQRIAKAKRLALMATYTAHPEGKAAVMVLSYGARPQTDLQRSLDARYRQPGLGQGAHSFTEHGDFTHLAGRGV